MAMPVGASEGSPNAEIVWPGRGACRWLDPAILSSFGRALGIREVTVPRGAPSVILSERRRLSGRRDDGGRERRISECGGRVGRGGGSVRRWLDPAILSSFGRAPGSRDLTVPRGAPSVILSERRRLSGRRDDGGRERRISECGGRVGRGGGEACAGGSILPS
jgi:hypothetical protein